MALTSTMLLAAWVWSSLAALPDGASRLGIGSRALLPASPAPTPSVSRNLAGSRPERVRRVSVPGWPHLLLGAKCQGIWLEVGRREYGESPYLDGLTCFWVQMILTKMQADVCCHCQPPLSRSTSPSNTRILLSCQRALTDVCIQAFQSSSCQSAFALMNSLDWLCQPKTLLKACSHVLGIFIGPCSCKSQGG